MCSSFFNTSERTVAVQLLYTKTKYLEWRNIWTTTRNWLCSLQNMPLLSVLTRFNPIQTFCTFTCECLVVTASLCFTSWIVHVHSCEVFVVGLRYNLLPGRSPALLGYIFYLAALDIILSRSMFTEFTSCSLLSTWYSTVITIFEKTTQHSKSSHEP